MSLAIDVANYSPLYTITPQSVQCLRNSGYTRAIVGCSYGDMARSQLVRFSEGGMEIEAYAWITHPFKPHLIERTFSVITGLPVRRVWLDAEDNTNGRGSAAVRQDIADAVAYVRKHRPDLKIGIYTGSWWWKPMTNDWQETFGLPLWLANYRDPDIGLKESEIPGGWTKNDVVLWQYAGTIDTCGINTDRNVIYAEEDEEMAITLVACGDSPTGYRVYALGQHGPTWITDPKAAADLQAAFGQPKGLSWAALKALGA